MTHDEFSSPASSYRSNPQASEPSPPTHPAPGDDGVARLLRSIAPPPAIPDAVRQRVRQATFDTWQVEVAGRRRRRRWIGGGLLAASVAGLLMLSRGWISAPEGDLAQVEAVIGPVLFAALDEPDAERHVGLGDVVTAPHRLRTQADSRVALRLAQGHALRLDRNTEIELRGGDQLVLHHGAVYVDSEPAGGTSQGPAARTPLRIHTPYGIARDIGTQFEVRVEDDRLRVRVREGRVEIDEPTGERRLEAVAGAELTVSDQGLLHRRAIEPHGPEWGWNLDIAPTFALEGSTLTEFLHWLGRETGWTIDYVDPAIAQQARTIVLHGDLEGIAIAQTPAFVLATCGLQHELRGATLWIDHQP